MPVPGMLYSATFDDTAETERDVDLGGSQADESRTSARRLTATVPARRHVCFDFAHTSKGIAFGSDLFESWCSLVHLKHHMSDGVACHLPSSEAVKSWADALQLLFVGRDG